MYLLTYKCVQLTAVSAFCLFISDYRRKERMVALIHPGSALFTKCCYPVPLIAWIWVVIRMEAITALDWGALGLSLAGITTTIVAKLHLGDRHSWAGYRIANATPISHGIYRYIRHPMYAGISLVILAGSLVIAPRLPLWLTVAVVLTNLWIIGFLAVVARRETAFLRPGMMPSTTRYQSSTATNTNHAGGYAWVISHGRRLVVELVNLCFHRRWCLRLLGVINRRLRLVESVFLVYPASAEFTEHYSYRHRARRHVWRPGPCGILRQNGKWIVMVAISATQSQLTDPTEAENLRRVAERMERLRHELGVPRKTFAGILPGLLYFKRIAREAPEADLTACAVCQAIDWVKSEESLPAETPVVVLGGKGFIGRRVVRLLGAATTYSIDVTDGEKVATWPAELKGRRIVVVNIATNGAVEEYAGWMESGTVVINEVYPQPSTTVLDQLAMQGCRYYHVAGVKGWAVPSFPMAYRGAIPCCAAWPSPDLQVVVRRLV